MSFSTDPKIASQHPTLTIGELGEQLVARWLQTQNWEILHHRWRCRWGEIDLIAQQRELAFVEVKTRSPRNWDADGRLAITPQKQGKLWQAAQQFLAQYPDRATLPCRFDVALVSYQPVSMRSAESSSASLSRHLSQPTLLNLTMQDEMASEEHRTDSSFSSEAVENAIPVSPIQLGQPIVTQGYRLILQDYIQSAFDGLL